MKTYRFSTRFRIMVPILLVLVVVCSIIASPLHDTEAEIKCFSVDSLDRLYVGFDEMIAVYNEGELVRSIDTSDFRSYYFTVQEDDTILLASATKGYTMDLDGNVLDSWDDLSAKTYNKLKAESKAFTSQNGDTYELKLASIWPRIVLNGETVIYKVDGLSAAVSILRAVAWALVWLLGVWELLNAVKTKWLSPKPDGYH